MTHLVIDESNSSSYEVGIEGESAQLNLDQLSVLFGLDRSVIGKHIRKTFSEVELEKTSVWANFAHTAENGKTFRQTTLIQMSSFQLDIGLNQSRVHALDNGQPVINDNDLATLTLLVAE